jgi:catechol 2,3-dioxygenase-like lactoylglutathione lyase family enzyme
VRRTALRLGLFVLCLALASGARAAQSVGCLALSVSSADALADFYSSVLDFARGEASARDGVKQVRLALGDECVELVEHRAERGRSIAPGARSNDLGFQHMAIVVRDMDRAYARLHAARVRQTSPEPQTIPAWNRPAAGIRAFYFRDPDGHDLELIWFPAGKGDPRWQAASERLFLGIDHTAIAVGDTPRSVAFYRDRLGLRVAGESENFGPEQERLNGVFGSRVRITGLRAERGIGIELLEYLAPSDGRPAPVDLRPSDLAFWATTVSVDDPSALGVEADGLLRDPDGHALRVVRGGRP